MKFINKIAALLLTLALTLTAPAALAEEAPLRVVTTIFPIYDWVREILGDADGVELTLLLDSGVDLHSYQPTAADIVKVAACDVFIYVGGESDEWVEDALKEAVNPDMRVVDLLDALGDAAKEEETVEGMEAEEEEGEEGEEGEEVEYDEHVWLSLRNAQALTGVIADALAESDGENADLYRANAEAYAGRLGELDGRYADAVASAELDTMLFGDRFPFRYLADDYGLTYYAAFSGCSAESEATFETIAFLAGKVDALELPAVLTIEGANHRVAETVVANTAAKDAAILVMDSMQGTTAADVAAGATYLGVMEGNLAALNQALNR